MENTEKLKYPGMRADISRCNALLHELCQIVWDRNYKAEQVMFSIPPVPRNFDMQFSAAFDELSAYRALGTIDDLTILVKARDDGRVVVLPCKVGTTVWSTRWWDMVKEKCSDSKGNTFYCEQMKHKVTKETYSPFGLDYADFGKRIFLARAEAEAALKGASDV